MEHPLPGAGHVQCVHAVSPLPGCGSASTQVDAVQDELPGHGPCLDESGGIGQDDSRIRVKCYLCGGGRSKTVATAEEIRFGCFASRKAFIQCASCRLIQLSPPWSGRELNDLYRDYWKRQDFDGLDGGHGGDGHCLLPRLPESPPVRLRLFL